MSVDAKRDCISPRRRGRSALFLLTIVTACAGETVTEPWDGVGVLGEYIVYEGFVRHYQLHLPQGYDPGRRAPLLIIHHGFGDTGTQFQEWTGLDAVAGEAGFITVWPDGTPAGGCIDDVPAEYCDPGPPFIWLPEDTGFTRELVAHLRDGLAVDSRRIYAAGFSMGGLFTYDIACQLDDIFAAVATVAALPRPVTAGSCNPSHLMSILITQGTEDATFDWEGEGGLLSMEENLAMWTDLNGCTGNPAVEWLPDIADEGTRAWTETYDNCDGSAEVRLLGIDGGGHIWPGLQFSPSAGLSNLDVSVNAEMTEFFSRHSK